VAPRLRREQTELDVVRAIAIGVRCEVGCSLTVFGQSYRVTDAVRKGDSWRNHRMC
jgi:hypothetical protein